MSCHITEKKPMLGYAGTPHREERKQIEADITEDELTISQVLAILQVMVRSKECLISIHNGELCCNGQPFAPSFAHLFDESLENRIELLAKRLGIPHLHSDFLCQIWQRMLTDHESLTWEQLFESAQRAAVWKTESAGPLLHWRQAIEKRVFEKMPGISCVEQFQTPPTPEQLKKTIELAPLFQDWPMRLLTHRDWAYSESPLPDIEPMSLDDVWVDVQLLDPLETGGVTLTDDLLQSLESRYEQQQWLSEPAQFILERLRNSAALIGAPGIGKTTLLKWLARQVIIQADGRFLLPLFVPLRKYVLDTHEPHDLLSFALRQCGITQPEQIDLWGNRLSYLTGTEKGTVLLLLDGWDEVPLQYRETLLHESDTLAYAFAMIITSRPSAYPLALPVDRFYEITELSPESVNNLIRR